MLKLKYKTMDNLESRVNRNVQNIQRAKYNDADKESAFTKIIERLYQGEALDKILKSDDTLPSGYTFFKWMLDPDYANIYAYAREVKAHKIFDECLSISDNLEGNEDSIANIQRDRLRLDARKFYLAKIAPKLYGDKIDVTSNGEAINVVSLGVGIAPPTLQQEPTYIDVTPTCIGDGDE